MQKYRRPHRASTKWLVAFWVLALLSIAGIYFDIGPDKGDMNGGGLVWALPALAFSFAGLAVVIIRMIRR